jgi:hypothetical protein
VGDCPTAKLAPREFIPPDSATDHSFAELREQARVHCWVEQIRIDRA